MKAQKKSLNELTEYLFQKQKEKPVVIMSQTGRIVRMYHKNVRWYYQSCTDTVKSVKRTEKSIKEDLGMFVDHHPCAMIIPSFGEARRILTMNPVVDANVEEKWSMNASESFSLIEK